MHLKRGRLADDLQNSSLILLNSQFLYSKIKGLIGEWCNGSLSSSGLTT